MFFDDTADADVDAALSTGVASNGKQTGLTPAATPTATATMDFIYPMPGFSERVTLYRHAMYALAVEQAVLGSVGACLGCPDRLWAALSPLQVWVVKLDPLRPKYKYTV